MLRKISLFFTLCTSILFTSSNFATTTHQHTPIKAVLFDVFGTVVDWHGTMLQEFITLFHQKEITDVTSEEFVEAWVDAYAENMSQISEGKAPFETVDALNRVALDNTLEKYHLLEKFTDSERQQMWLIWHRLTPWPDSVPGLNKLKESFIIGTLSNGNVKLLVDLSKFAKLDWDVILSGEFIGHYKPNPLVYQNAAKILNLDPSEILLVASHQYDLKAAQKCGYKTAYIFRPLEYGAPINDQIADDKAYDFTTTSIEKLADVLNAVH